MRIPHGTHHSITSKLRNVVQVLVGIRARTAAIAVVSKRDGRIARITTARADRSRTATCVVSFLVQIQAQLLQLQIVTDQLLLLVIQLSQFRLQFQNTKHDTHISILRMSFRGL